MRLAARTGVLIFISMTLLAAATWPVSADQFIRYKGTTAAPSNNHVHVGVLRRESGRRVLRYIAFRLTVTCEDSSTNQRNVVLRYRRLDENGDFSVEVPRVVKGTYLRLDGSIKWGWGSGTVLFNSSKLIEDGSDAQLCSTGELIWTVDRKSSHPYRLLTHTSEPNGRWGGLSVEARA